MTLEHNTLNFSQIYEQLKPVKKWLQETHKIDLTKSRFELIDARLKELRDAHTKNQLKDFFEGKDARTYIIAPIDALAFIDIYKAFNHLKPHESLPKTKLQKAINGPYLSEDEDLENNESRNILFELELASVFQKRGINITSFDDFGFNFQGVRVLVECKRPVNKTTLVSNINYAAQKLNRQIDNSQQESRGLIAIAVDKIFGVDKGILDVKTTSQMENAVDNSMMSLISQHREKYWASMININFLGVIFILNYIAKSNDRYSKGYQGIVDSVQTSHPAQMKNHLILDHLQKIMSPIQQ